MASKSSADLLAASGAFLERCMDEERAEIIERLCASAAPGWKRVVDWYQDERLHVGLTALTESVWRSENIVHFSDLYGDWVYQP